MGKKRFILWPVSHIEEITRHDFENIMALVGKSKATLFFEFGGSDSFDRLVGKLINRAHDCEAEITAFMDKMNVAEPMRKHVSGKFMLIKWLSERASGVEVVPIDYKPERRKELLSETDYLFYAHDAMERGLANSPSQKAGTVLGIMHGDNRSLKKLLVDDAFTLIGVEKRDSLREEVMTKNLAQRLAMPDDNVFIMIIGAYHEGAISAYLDNRRDVELIFYSGRDIQRFSADREKAAASGARTLVSEEAYNGFVEETIEISKAFIGSDMLAPNLRAHYAQTTGKIIDALPEDKDLYIDKAFAKHSFGNFVALMAHFPNIGGDTKIVVNDATEFGCTIDSLGAVRFQTLDRVFRRFSSALASGSWKGRERELAEQIFKTETERDDRKLARKEEKRKELSPS